MIWRNFVPGTSRLTLWLVQSWTRDPTRRIASSSDAYSVILDFNSEAAVRTSHSDCDAMCAGMFCGVADCLLPNAIGGDLDRRRQDREVT